MKLIGKATMIAICLMGLSSCKINMGIDYKDYCWESCHKTNQCGKCIKHHCEGICAECKAHGKACEACWECLRQDVCMY